MAKLDTIPAPVYRLELTADEAAVLRALINASSGAGPHWDIWDALKSVPGRYSINGNIEIVEEEQE